MCDARWTHAERQPTFDGAQDYDLFGVCECDNPDGFEAGDLILHAVSRENDTVWIGIQKKGSDLSWLRLPLDRAQEFGVRLVHATTYPEQYRT